ncbi:MAG TPA: hypothetical protein VG013_41075 [Gemmataceae bacterium]|jgi:hypothetical protein|nr:hypothetical protein [Gemmataceae bacterium]
MPALTGQLDPDDALVGVLIGISRTRAQQLRSAYRAVPAAVQLTAVLDTGAECTCVDGQVIASLTLPVAGIGFVNAPALTGLTAAAQFDASLTILDPSGNASDNLLVGDLLIADQPLGKVSYLVLLGRDVLALCSICTQGDPALSPRRIDGCA